MCKDKSLLGLSLLEILLSLALSVSILSILVSEFLLAKQNKFRQQNLIAMQENAMQAFFYLKHSITHKAYLGCTKLTEKLIFSAPFSLLHYTNVLQGNDKSITVRNASANNAILLKKAQNNLLLVSHDLKIKPNEWIILSDCAHAELASVYETHANYIKLKHPLKFNFSPFAEIRKLEINTFYLRTHGIYKSLYRISLQGERIALIDYLRDMYILYDELKAGKISRVKGGDVQHWENVKGVFIVLYLVAKDDIQSMQEWPLYIAVS